MKVMILEVTGQYLLQCLPFKPLLSGAALIAFLQVNARHISADC